MFIPKAFEFGVISTNNHIVMFTTMNGFFNMKNMDTINARKTFFQIRIDFMGIFFGILYLLQYLMRLS